jgi:hypothetical protein
MAVTDQQLAFESIDTDLGDDDLVQRIRSYLEPPKPPVTATPAISPGIPGPDPGGITGEPAAGPVPVPPGQSAVQPSAPTPQTSPGVPSWAEPIPEELLKMPAGQPNLAVKGAGPATSEAASSGDPLLDAARSNIIDKRRQAEFSNRGILRAGASALAGSAVDFASGAMRAIHTVLPGEYATHDEPGSVRGWFKEGVEGIKRYQEERPFLQKDPRSEGIGSDLYQGLRSFSQSLLSGMPAAAAGAAIGSTFAPGIGTALGAVAGFALGAGTMLGLSQYDDVMERGTAHFMSQGLDRKTAEARVQPEAMVQGAAEGGLEFVSNILGGWLMGAGKILTAPAKEAFKGAVKELTKTSISTHVRRIAGSMAAEVSMEMLTQGIETESDYRLGIGSQRFWEGAKEAFGPTVVASMLFAGLGHANVKYAQHKVIKALEDGNADPKDRVKAAVAVGQEFKSIDPVLAQAWYDSTQEAIKNNESISVSEDIRESLKERIDNILKTPKAAWTEAQTINYTNYVMQYHALLPAPGETTGEAGVPAVRSEGGPIVPTGGSPPSPGQGELPGVVRSGLPPGEGETPEALPGQQADGALPGAQGFDLGSQGVGAKGTDLGGLTTVQLTDRRLDAEKRADNLAQHLNLIKRAISKQTNAEKRAKLIAERDRVGAMVTGYRADIDLIDSHIADTATRSKAKSAEESAAVLEREAQMIQAPQGAEGLREQLAGQEAQGLQQGAMYQGEKAAFLSEEAAKADRIDQAANASATSLLNDTNQPTDAQIAAGNYAKGHIPPADLHGLDMTVENPAGSVRSGVGPEGAWQTLLKDHYGYLKRTEGKDGDNLDAFLGPHHASTKVFVVDQQDPTTGRMDEHKVMLGFNDEQGAREGYLRNYDETGPDRIKGITEMTIDQFKAWSKKATDVDAAKFMFSPEAIAIANKTSRPGGIGKNVPLVPRYVAATSTVGESILDYGAGKANAEGVLPHTKMLQDLGHDVTAHDFGTNVVHGLHDPQALSRQYDTVYASNVLNVQQNRKMMNTTMDEIHRAVKPDGRAILNFPLTPRKNNITVDELVSMMSERFTDVKRVGGTKQAPVFELRGPKEATYEGASAEGVDGEVRGRQEESGRSVSERSQGGPTAGAGGVFQGQKGGKNLSEITVKLTVSDQSGKSYLVSRNAEAAMNEVDNHIDACLELLNCLKG